MRETPDQHAQLEEAAIATLEGAWAAVRDAPPELAEAALLGAAATILGLALAQGGSAAEDAVNAVWGANRLPWRVTRVH